MIRRHLFFSLLLGACIGAAPTFAQTKAPARKSLPPRSKTSKTAAPRAASLAWNRMPVPLLLGVGTVALLVGGALGYALRKPATKTGENSKTADLFDQMAFPLALVDENERITRHNPAFQQFFGAENVQFPQLFHPEDLARARSHFQDTLTGARPNFSLPCRFFGAGGAPLHAEMNGQKATGARLGGPLLLAWRDATAQASAERELMGAREAISALYQVIAGDKTRDLDGKIRSLLAMGCGRFELPVGVLGRLTGEEFETLWVQSPDRRVRPALTFSRSNLAQGSGEVALLGLDSLPHRKNWQKTPFVAKNEGTAYLGAPVLIENELFGMLSFASLSPRDKPFASEEIELLQLMADWVGGEIERENNKAALEKQQKALLELNEKLERLATHDPLTGAKNRRAFNEKLDEEWSRARRYGTPLSLVMLDVDKFKLYNDSFGHPAGDEVLKRVASILMAAIRATDFVARYGGEEFVLILTNTDAEGAMILAGRLRASIEQAPWKERAVTASLGVSTLLATHKTGAELLGDADGALYHSKEKGRNRVTHTRQIEPEPQELGASSEGKTPSEAS